MGIQTKPEWSEYSPAYDDYDDYLADLSLYNETLFRLESGFKAQYFEAYKKMKIDKEREPNAFEKDAIVQAMLAVFEAKFSVPVPTL
jgi:hypothetical protein